MRYLSSTLIGISSLFLVCSMVYSMEALTSGIQEQEEPLCFAYVEGKKAQFIFPVIDTEKWVWHQTETRESALEYSWEVAVEGDGFWYDFGFFLFKPPVKLPAIKPKEGSLIDILRASQSSILEMRQTNKGSDGDFRHDLKVTGWIDEGSVVVGILDEKTFDAVLKNKPKEAHFRIRNPQTKKSFTCTSSIEY